MVGRVVALCFLVALWPSFASAQSAAMMDAFNQFQTLYQQGRYAEAERFAHKALELSKKEFGPDHPKTVTERKHKKKRLSFNHLRSCTPSPFASYVVRLWLVWGQTWQHLATNSAQKYRPPAAAAGGPT